MALVLLPGVLTFMGQLERFQIFVNFDHYFGYALPPTCYLYVRSLVYGSVGHLKWRFLHFLPAIASTAYFAQFHLASETEQLQYLAELNQSVNGTEGQVAIYIYFFHAIVYLMLSFRCLKDYASQENLTAKSRKLNSRWIIVFLAHQLLTNVFITYLTFTGNTPEKDALMIFFASVGYYYFIYLIFRYSTIIHPDLNRSHTGIDKLNIELVRKELANRLTERELEVLLYLLQNLNNTEIAEKAFLSVNTVKFHLKKVYEKLGVSSRLEALHLAYKIGGQ